MPRPRQGLAIIRVVLVMTISDSPIHDGRPGVDLTLGQAAQLRWRGDIGYAQTKHPRSSMMVSILRLAVKFPEKGG
ncbi:hypothetical protein A5686_03815 [Mycobacterium sp. E2479]|nr:hypothetical protein A5686_03815 [Mycobacterium sp. E2479]